MDPHVITDKNAVVAMFGHWPRHAQSQLSSALAGLAAQTAQNELLHTLRTLCAPGPHESKSPVAKVEFVTDSDYSDQVYWSPEVYLHHADGSVEQFEWPDETSDAEADTFEDLVAEFSRLDPPEEDAHLIVTLASGEFNVSGKWSIV